jgi:RNA polymerase sigma factor (sigma-70 family)
MRSDATLAERFAAGDEAAFDVIYERHRPVVLAVCMGVLGTPADAEDATQETFSALAVTLRTRPPTELRPWLIRVARNASIDTTRRRRHRLLTLDGEIPEVAARPSGPGKAELAVVLDGIRELPEGQRMALLMRELGGHSYAEIAEFLATDEEAVKGLIARARVGLRTYREATELSCASARNTIAAEPDGRRYDKTIRRHLRSCVSCRAYREALRDDAKALRAALPIQAGAVATGSVGTGMLTAAKGTLLGYGLTQAATTCAASACAVGAIGGMVFVAPVHRLGLPPILPITTPVVHTHTAAVKAPVKHGLALTAQRTHGVSGASQSSQPTSYSPPASASTPTVTHGPALARHEHMTVTHVVLPRLPKRHAHGTDAPGQAAADNQGGGNPGQGHGHGYGNQDQGNSNQGQGNAASPGQGQGQSYAQGDQGHGNGNGNGHAYGSSKNATQSSTPASRLSPASTQNSAAGNAQAAVVPSTHAGSDQGAQGNGNGGRGRGNGNLGQGNGHGRSGAGGQAGNKHFATASAATTTGSPASTTPTTVTYTAPPTTSTVTSSSNVGSSGANPGQAHGHGWGNGRGHGNQAAAAQNSTSAQSDAPPTITIDYGSNGSNGHGHGSGHGR